MTARVTTLSSSAGGIGDYYGEQVAGYYGDGGPTAFWYGAGAAGMGLAGVPTKDQITALMDGIDPGTGEKLGRRFSKSKERPSARGYDLTFSAPKDISVYWALTNDAERAEIESAINDASLAVLEHFDKTCPIRVGGNSEVVTGAGITAAVIPEHTSRAGDPNLHVHCVISSKIQNPATGNWYALDARELKQHQHTLSALFHRGLEAELTRRLGFGWGTRESGHATPLLGADPKVCKALSARTVDVNALYKTKLERFQTNYERDPSPRELHQLKREAAAASRPKKVPIVETSERHRWTETAASITETAIAEATTELNKATTPTAITKAAKNLADAELSYIDRIKTAAAIPVTMTPELAAAVDDSAVGELTDKRSTWREGHLVLEIARHLPSGLDLTAGAVVRGAYIHAQQIIDRTHTTSVDVIEVSEGADDVMRTFTTREVLAQETQIATWFDTAFSAPADGVAGDVDEHANRPLSEGQSQAAARTAGTAPVELIVGPAGTGKTTALQAAVKSLQSQGRDVFGLAPSTGAADVLGDETGCATENITKFLWEHTQRDKGPLPEFVLGAGATLIIDEAGMVSTPQWHTLTSLAQTHGWRIVAVGDGFQFSAVGRGGMFDLMARTGPADRVTQLDKVHRFANEWEAETSLLLRDGDPAVIDTYLEHQRILPAATDKTAIATAADWWMDHHDTHHSLVTRRTKGPAPELGLFATSNATVDAINKEIQDQRAKFGDIHSGFSLGSTKQNRRIFAIGDHVVTRRNQRDLLTDRGHHIRNRDRWTITGYNQDTGTITIHGQTGTAHIPFDYAAAHLQLAYAQTSHAAQGRTVDHSVLVVGTDDLIDRASIYVPLTRGRADNHVIIAGTATLDEAADRLTTGISRRWIDSPAITHLTPTPTAQTTKNAPAAPAAPTLGELVAAARRKLAETEAAMGDVQRKRDRTRARHDEARQRWDPRVAAVKQAHDKAFDKRQTLMDNQPYLGVKKWAAKVDALDVELGELKTKYDALTKAAAKHTTPLKRSADQAHKTWADLFNETETTKLRVRQLETALQGPDLGHHLGD